MIFGLCRRRNRRRKKSPTRRGRRGQYGFSLIEAMLASFVFTVGALGMLRLIYASREGTRVASKVTQATALARSRLDNLMILPYDNAFLDVGEHEDTGSNLGPTGAPFASDGTATGSFGDPDGWFARKWTVTENATGVLKSITVEVSWWDPARKITREVVITGARSAQ